MWTSSTGVRLDRDIHSTGYITSIGNFSISASTKTTSNASAGYYACYIKDEYGNLVSGTYGYGWN